MISIEKREPYYFTWKGIKKIEKEYNAKYMGYWCVRGKHVEWASIPVEVFYQPNPNIELGHSNYFGIYLQDGKTFICDAVSAFSSPIIGILEHDVVYVSRYCRDCVCTPNNSTIDGGRDHILYNGNNIELVQISVIDGEFIFDKRS